MRALAWVPVGDVNNPASVDMPIICCNHRCTPGEGSGCRENDFGQLSYPFEIQGANVRFRDYVDFLNAVAQTDSNKLWGISVEAWISRSGRRGSYSYHLADAALADLPAVGINWFTMLRFANWMHNGRPLGPQDVTTTEDGAYPLLGGNPPWVQRRPTARVVLANEDEWYKAAFYDPASRSYSRFAWGDGPARGVSVAAARFGEDTNLCPTVPEARACECPLSSGPNELTPVCAYPGRSPYGLCDTTGNVFDVLETREVSSGGTGASPAGTILAVVKGGAFNIPGFCDAAADGRNFLDLQTGSHSGGFRLVRLTVPEPSRSLASVSALAAVALLRAIQGFRRTPEPDLTGAGFTAVRAIGGSGTVPTVSRGSAPDPADPAR